MDYQRIMKELSQKLTKNMAEISVLFYADREGTHFQIFEIRKIKKYFRVSDPQSY
jgi:hypothetical protein